MMRTVCVPTVACLAGFLFTSAVSANPVEAPIQAVTVYPNGALVERVGSVELRAGENEFQVSGLPRAADPIQSWEVRAEGFDVLPLGASLELVFAEPDSERIRELRDQLDAAKIEKRENAAAIAANREESAFLRSLRERRAEMIREDVGTEPFDAASARETLSFISQNTLRLENRWRVLVAEQEVINRRIQELEAELRRAGGRRESSQVATFRVRAAQSGSAELRLSYRTGSAAWSPTYDAHLDSAAGTVRLEVAAKVQQRGGEDWEGVRLTLSTAQPSGRQNAPELSPVYLEPVREEDMVFVLPAFGQDPDSGYIGRLNQNVRDLPMSVDAVTEEFLGSIGATGVATSAISTTYQIPGLWTLRSGADAQRVVIDALDVEPTLRRIIVPRLSESAFVQGEASNDSDLLLLPGTIQVYADGAFAATTQMPMVQPGETFDLALGVDRNLSVDFRQIDRSFDYGGLFNKKTTVSYHEATELINRGPEAVTVVLRDRLPISRDEQIEVVQQEPNPRRMAPDDKGILEWKLTLEPGAEETIDLRYQIRFPEELEVQLPD